MGLISLRVEPKGTGTWNPTVNRTLPLSSWTQTAMKFGDGRYGKPTLRFDHRLWYRISDNKSLNVNDKTTAGLIV